MIDALSDKGKKALEALSKKSQEEIDHIVHQMSLAAVDQHMVLAKLAHEETGRGIYEDKAIKNLYASEYIWNSIKDNKTVGIIGEDKEKGLCMRTNWCYLWCYANNKSYVDNYF
ncbi:hypothetical protein ACVPOW_12775 [Staphylococcus aureus]